MCVWGGSECIGVFGCALVCTRGYMYVYVRACLYVLALLSFLEVLSIS